MSTLNRLLAGVLTVAATVATTAATVSAEHALPQVHDSVAAAPVRIMPLGDSITDGVGMPGGYRIGLRQKLVEAGRSTDFVGSMVNGPGSLVDRDHEGHSGWTIGQIHNNVVNWLRTYTPRTILLHIGTNDMYGSDPGGAPQRLSALIDRITTQSSNADLFVATIIPIRFADQTVRTYNASLTTIVRNKAAQGKRVHLVDMYPAVPVADLPDGIHPNAAGYGKMATTWYNALRTVPGSIGDPPPGGGTACEATASVVGSWNGGFQGEVSVRNATTSPIDGWTVQLTLPGGQSITNVWGGTATGGSGLVSVKNAAYNGAVPSGGSTTFGFVASGSAAAGVDSAICASP